MKKREGNAKSEVRMAQAVWGPISEPTANALAQLVQTYSFSVRLGDLLYLGNRWYVTHSGLLRLSRRQGCAGIDVRPVLPFCDPQSATRWAFKATVYKSNKLSRVCRIRRCRSVQCFSVVHGAEMRVAETRAVNRALRKAYGIGICSVEEIGSFAEPSQPPRETKKLPPQPANGNYGGPKVRDRLCQLIRQHQLDASLVKSYATDFCGVKTLRQATREQVENFVTHLADWAEKDRNALTCQLNSYLGQKEGAA